MSSMKRRRFLTQTTGAVGIGTLLPSSTFAANKKSYEDEWDALRDQFLLTKDKVHMAQFFLASHPPSVRAAIERYQKAMDQSPSECWHHEFFEQQEKITAAAAKYLECDPSEIALTDSTTMGLGILYSGFKLNPGDEILTTTHDHYSTVKSLEFAAAKSGARVKRIDLYTNSAETTVDEILSNLKKGINASTRVVAVTFVHSISGVKLPIHEMSKVIKEANANRDEKERIYFCVDGVHGFGVENITVESLGCDFMAAGTHKWLYGPRGTGILWAKKDAWDMVEPIIPPFSQAYFMWMETMPERPLTFYEKITPGGFHSFEYRWALKEAFEFHLDLGKEKIQNRTHHLNTMMKEGMKNIDHVILHTPMTTTLSSGINSFEIKGIDPEEVVVKLDKAKIIASTTPYKTIYARLTPCILNSEEEVSYCLKTLEDIHSL